MWSNKANEVPLKNSRSSPNRDSNRGMLRHIENKLEVAPTSTAVFDSIMDTKKPSASATRKISRKASRSSSQNKSRKEKSSRSPLRVTTLESNVKKSCRVEFREPLASYRETYGSPPYQASSETKRLLAGLEGSEAENKTEGLSRMIYERDERDLHSRDFDSPLYAAEDTIVRYLNDRPAIDALQSSEDLFKAVTPTRSEEEKTDGSGGDECSTKTPLNSAGQEAEQKGLRVIESSASSTSTSSTHRLDILKRRQHDAKLEKLKERIRKQWEHSEELSSSTQHLGYADLPVVVTTVENAVTPKVRKVATAPPAPAYKGFNPAETKIRTPDGKVWQEEDFHNISRELYRDLALQLTEDSTMKERSTDRNKERKVTRPVRKVQKVVRASSPDLKAGGSQLISASSWRDGQKLVKKILGPAPKVEQDKRSASSDRTGRERTTIFAESDPKLDVSHKTRPRSSDRSRSKVRSEKNLKKMDSAPSDGKQGEDHSSLNKDFLPVEIRGILDDLQLDSVTQCTMEETDEKNDQKSAFTTQSHRSHSPTKRKPDKLAASEESQVISKKRHYDTDEVRQYMVKQQEERKRRQNEEKKAQKEATEQKNKRLQELYKKQREAFANKAKNMTAPEPSAAIRLQETYSKLLLERTLLEEPPAVQEMQLRPGYQPSGESDKENKAQERPPSTSSSSDMSLSEPPQPLVRNDMMEPSWIQPDRLSPKVQLPRSQPLSCSTGGLFSHLLNLEQIGLLQKDFDLVRSSRRNNTAMGSLTLSSQPCLISPPTPHDLFGKPGSSPYKSKLDRIEALKATAASLSNRIESEAKKLAGAGINYGSVWNSEHDLLPANQDDGRWAKTGSPPVREDNDDDFSARIQKMLGTCVSRTVFDDNLPGMCNLGEFKKLPEMIRPHTAAVSLGIRSPASHRSEGLLGHLPKRQTDSPGTESKVIIPHDSSADSISEGPLMSEGSLCEEEGSQCEQPPLKMAEILKEKEFCIGDRNGYEPIKDFQKEAEKYPPLFTQTGGAQGTWDDLAKGSPHSVINIFAKSYLHGKGKRTGGRGSPPLRLLLPAMSPPDSVVSYEDDFISSQASGTLTDKKIALEPSIGSSNSSIQEELPSRKSPYEPRSIELTSHHSPGPCSAASSRSSASSKRRGRKESNSHHFSVEENKMSSESEHGSQQAKKSLPISRVSNRDQEQNPDADSTLDELSGNSLMSLPDKVRSQKTPSSPPSPGVQKLFDPLVNTAERIRSPASCPVTTASGFKPNVTFSDANLGTNRTGAGAATMTGSMRFSPAGLQNRMTAELSYLSAIEESVRQLSDVERVRGISLAQQESVSLAQILKAQQQRHEWDLALLKLKAKQEALESQRQLEEARQKAAQVHADSLQQLVQSRREAAEVLQETTSKITAQQVEAALLTTDAALQIREMTELARAQISDAVSAPAAPITTLFDRQRQHHSEFMKQLRARADTNRKTESGIPSQSKEEPAVSKQQYSPSFDKTIRLYNHSPSVPSSKENKKSSRHEKMNSSIEEQACTVVDDSLPSDSIPSIPDEKDSTSIATEYSLKFDESMTEDEIEEKSFRSLLPSESHRRINMEKKRGHRDDSDEEAAPEKTTLSVKELSMPFSGGQDSFSKFTMEMVRQYMKEEEMRAAHQSSLLRLREKALKEKTKAELAWLEHQKKHLRDKGEDDKMPPIRKRQRGLLLKLQQEKAEIKRLQEANKEARKERQLILKQQEEIERISQTTMKLQEKLKSAGENKLELHSEDDIKQNNASSPLPTDGETRSPSPISISSSETSSIMQKLKKMRSRMDEKFLTKREQKLMQRRQYAEELLEWKRRLDAEEAEIRRIEKQALAAWDKELLKTKLAKKDLGDQRAEPKETASEEESPIPPCSHLNSESSVPEELGSPAAESVQSEAVDQGQPRSPNQSTLAEEMVYTQEVESAASPGKLSPSKTFTSVSKQDFSKASHRTGGQLHLPMKSHEGSHSWSDESLSMTQSETTSDQSDIEGRIRALKDELRKRKSVVYQLKKEQKKRQKERLKAQEASLIKQLESYDEFIKKTEAELSRDLEASPTAKPQIKTQSSASEKPKIKPPPLHRPETTKNWKSLTESERTRGSLESIAGHVVMYSKRPTSVRAKRLVETEMHTEEPSRTQSPFLKSSTRSRGESGDSLESVPSLPLLKDLRENGKISHVLMSILEDASGDETIISSHKSEIHEDIKSEESECEGAYNKHSEKSDALFTVGVEQKKDDVQEEEDVQSDQWARSDRSSCILSKWAQEKEFFLSQQISIQKELYSEDFERSSPKKEISNEGMPLAEHYKDDFEMATLSLNKNSQSKGEKLQHTKTTRSKSTSLGSDDEISEYLSGKSLSVSGSVHSERLLELKSPTELMKNKERSDVEKELVSAESWPSISVTRDEDALLNFSIGDRVLVSNVQPGTLQFKGQTSFAEGFWAGVELDKPEGNNNGTYDGIKYFDCKEKHGIFAPPQKISHISESFDRYLSTNEDDDSFFYDSLGQHHKAEQRDKERLNSVEDKEGKGKDTSEKYSHGKAPKSSMSALETSVMGKEDMESSSKTNHIQEASAVVESLSQEPSMVDCLKLSVEGEIVICRTPETEEVKVSDVVLEETPDYLFTEELNRQHSSEQENAEELNNLSSDVLEKPATPLLDLLTKERSQLEAQFRLPDGEEEKSKDQLEKVSLLTDSLLQAFVKDTVNQLQKIQKDRNEKIQLSNQELCDVQEKLSSRISNLFLSSELEDEREEVSSPDMCPRPESPVFGASGQEELAKRLAELELSRDFLKVLGDDQDWFDEDFGLSSRKVPQKQAEEPAVLPKLDPQKTPPKPCEEPLVVPHTAVEVEDMVHAAAEELWQCKELGCDFQTITFPRDVDTAAKEEDVETVSKQAYKQAVFDLTREIFGEILAEDPNLNQPIWMKPCRFTSTYFRRVKDPKDLDEIKSFIAAEVLKLFSLKKEPNHKTDWQKMMKFGRKKRDRVDHILVQELHEEEAQWVNYDEDELCVKMQLADGIFEALIRDTIDVLNQINEKQGRLLLV
uniref:Centrosomal protein 350 n=1 Tax=Sphenodon punctatus TaxID=8508 RepID=A0A8D0HP92_SPHPU